ncbi:MAG: hypothetical protein R3F61_13895 [Myxococcota bacterium]
MLALALLACQTAAVPVNTGDSADPTAPDAPPTVPVNPGDPDDPAPPVLPDDSDVPLGEDACTLGEGTCSAWNAGIACVSTPLGTRWEPQTCGAGEGCVRGTCAPQACSDECYAGQTSNGQACELYDLGSGSWVGLDDEDSLHDRARTFERWIRKDTESLFHDGIVSVRYETAALQDVESIYIGDTALHTGIYLTAEALRLQETGSERARRNVVGLVDYFHLLLNVSGDPGMLATHAVPAGDPDIRAWTNWDCAQFDRFCNVPWNGSSWDYIGEPSRDMYMGPLLGLLEAHDALTEVDAPVRHQIREDLVTIAMELKRARSMPVRFEVNGVSLPPMQMDIRFFIPEAGTATTPGAITATIDLSDLDNSGTIDGGQEFLPNPSAFFRQSPLVPNWIPDIPRTSSAMMVPAMLLSAIHVTEDRPEWAAERAELIDFYENNADLYGNVDDWIDYASMYVNHRECGERYFGYNLAVIPLQVWMRLEYDAARRDAIRTRVWSQVWDDVHDHKNPFFDFAYVAGNPGAPQSIADEAAFQTSLFREPPRIDRNVDLTNSPNYDEDPDCDGLSSTALDVDDRPAEYFQWHSAPWTWVHEGNPRQTYPGHDYLLAYWMARRNGALMDEAPQRCLRWH